jgi:2'-5' RNA ligase
VTLTVPFAWDARTAHAELGRIAAAARPFDIALEHSDWFHTDETHVLWLAPIPLQPFRRLISDLVDAFPGFPPYGGAYDEVIPHVTVAAGADQAALRTIDASLTTLLPLRDRATELALVRVEGGAAGIEQRWPLGG